MRTYQSESKEKKSKNGKKIAYSVLTVVGILIIATVITLSLTLGKAPVIDNQDPGADKPAVTPPAKVYVSPLLDFSIGSMASLDKVVYSSSMNNWRTHNGIDFLASAGADVLSITSGTVTKVQKTVLEGTIVTIDHGDGVIASYKGLASNPNVAVGAVVEGGSVIGKIAEVMPLERDAGAHLHLETRLNGKLVDPALYLTDLGEK